MCLLFFCLSEALLAVLTKKCRLKSFSGYILLKNGLKRERGILRCRQIGESAGAALIAHGC
ncbi:MAG: hypothetical protein DU429_06365 [Candidatus Tokpelaia sp.]|nr:MAG: hypothetical protein DU429_06365 [Candidatus Tokpelaia sp.]